MKQFVVKVHSSNNPRARKWFYLSGGKITENPLFADKLPEVQAKTLAEEYKDFGGKIEEYVPQTVLVEHVTFEDGKAVTTSSEEVKL